MEDISGNGVFLWDLSQAAYELSEYLENLGAATEADRDVMLTLTHNISEAYVVWANSVDNAQVLVVD